MISQRPLLTLQKLPQRHNICGAILIYAKFLKLQTQRNDQLFQESIWTCLCISRIVQNSEWTKCKWQPTI